MPKLFSLHRFVLLLLLFLPGFARSAEARELQVISSIKPLSLLAEALAVEEVKNHTLLGTNADPHEFALRVSDRTRLEQADLVIWLGPNFERFLPKALGKKPAQLELGGLPGLTWPQGKTSLDLHIWLNPANAKLIAQAIADKLCEQLPARAAGIRQRLQVLNERIDSVSAQIKTRLQPVQKEAFGVDHDGYGHWVDYFSLNQVAALSALPEQHLGAKHLTEVKHRLVGARCVITDFAEGNQAKLQELLKLPVQVADPLAQARSYHDYGDYLLALADVFSACLTPRG